MRELASEILSKYHSILDGLPPKGEGSLKFGKNLVKISSIATGMHLVRTGLGNKL